MIKTYILLAVYYIIPLILCFVCKYINKRFSGIEIGKRKIKLKKVLDFSVLCISAVFYALADEIIRNNDWSNGWMLLAVFILLFILRD